MRVYLLLGYLQLYKETRRGDIYSPIHTPTASEGVRAHTRVPAYLRTYGAPSLL